METSLSARITVLKAGHGERDQANDGEAQCPLTQSPDMDHASPPLTGDQNPVTGEHLRVARPGALGGPHVIDAWLVKAAQ